jgi:[NiFe] hydrogenase diaphorase moiety small subunit
MSAKVGFTIDGKEILAEQGYTILQAAALAGIYIPHLCAKKGLSPWGSCRVCTVLVNGRPQAACTMPVAEGMVVENDTPELKDLRASLVEMLFVEGPRHPYMFPNRPVDASHPDVMLDFNRCILCARCVRASQEQDGKHVFQFVHRGGHKRIGINAAVGASATNLQVTDTVEACPVGCIIPKRIGFAVPVGQRVYDKKPIGSDIEAGNAAAK